MNFVPFIWALLGIILITTEFFVPGFVVFFFGLGAGAAALLTGFFPSLRENVPLQLLFWLFSSAVSVFTLRKYFARAFKGRLITGLDESSVIGERAYVVESIGPDRPGRIRFQGTTWTAVSYDEHLPAGRTVEILQKEGMTFTVTGSILGSSDPSPPEDTK